MTPKIAVKDVASTSLEFGKLLGQAVLEICIPLRPLPSSLFSIVFVQRCPFGLPTSDRQRGLVSFTHLSLEHGRQPFFGKRSRVPIHQPAIGKSSVVGAQLRKNRPRNSPVRASGMPVRVSASARMRRTAQSPTRTASRGRIQTAGWANAPTESNPSSNAKTADRAERAIAFKPVRLVR